jgi:seryl-tRNA synthetase
MQEISIINMVLLCVSFVGLGIAIIAIQSNRKLSLRLNKALELINSLYKTNEAHQKKLDALERSQKDSYEQIKQKLAEELESAVTVLTTNIMQSHMTEIEALKFDIDKLMAQIDELSQQDPAAKMYAKAHSLVASGASINEIIDACDLPKAEVEVLMGFQEKARK